MSRSTQSPRSWIPLCILFGTATLTVPLMGPWRQHREPRVLPELVAVAEQHLGLHAVAAGRSQAGIYLCRSVGLTPDDMPMTRQREALSKWKGMVFVIELPANDSHLQQNLDEWGDAAAVLGDLLLWGDPALVAEIAQAGGNDRR
jgi:hypothetical protein